MGDCQITRNLNTTKEIMPDLPSNTAQNIDEFNDQARSFVAKSRSQGASNTAIAGAINYMYKLYGDSQVEDTAGNWQFIDKDGDGVMDTKYNVKTGEEQTLDYGTTNSVLENIDNDYSEGMPTQSNVPRSALTAPGASGYDAGRSTEAGEQVWSTSELENLENEQDFSNAASAPAATMSQVPGPQNQPYQPPNPFGQFGFDPFPQAELSKRDPNQQPLSREQLLAGNMKQIF